MRRMYFGEYANGMITGSRNTGFGYMIAFFVNIFVAVFSELYLTIPMDSNL